MPLLRVAPVAIVSALPFIVHAQGDPAALAKIVDEGKNHSQVMRILDHITHKIGARLTGSPQLNNGEKWAMGQFKRWGLTNVHLEKWGEVPVGSSRGPVNFARMVEPFDSPMEFTTPSWTNGTKGLVRAAAVLAPMTPEEVEARKAELAGKWVVFPVGYSATRPGTAGPTKEAVEALEKLPIAGRIYGSRNELVITSGTWRDKTFENHPGSPQIIIRASDHDRVLRNLNNKRNVVLEINVDNRWQKGPVPQFNVVAEIKGTEKPEEVVIVSGHFDSWNGPGSEGALDNGTGSSTAMEAARILMATKAKPKRTIRFVLWTGEEQGLFGSTEYVKQHAAELDKISAVLVDDGGTNYQGGYQAIASQEAMLKAAIAPTVAAFPNLPMEIKISERMPRGGGSDHVPFNREGVPGFFTIETGRSDYNFVHHTQHDRYEMAIPEYLVQSATNHAVVAYNLACADTMLPREPKPAAPTN